MVSMVNCETKTKMSLTNPCALPQKIIKKKQRRETFGTPYESYWDLTSFGVMLRNLTPHWYHVTEFNTPEFFTKKFQNNWYKNKTCAFPRYRANPLLEKLNRLKITAKPVTWCLQNRLIVRYQLNGYSLHLEFLDSVKKNRLYSNWRTSANRLENWWFVG